MFIKVNLRYCVYIFIKYYIFVFLKNFMNLGIFIYHSIRRNFNLKIFIKDFLFVEINGCLVFYLKEFFVFINLNVIVKKD